MAEMMPRCGDHVLHRPSGETWVVAYADARRDEVSAAGWPDSTARLSDCEVVMRVTDALHMNEVKAWRQHGCSSRRGKVLAMYGAALRAREAIMEGISGPLSNMKGGCFNPNEDPRGECADGNCYCSRFTGHCADAALKALRKANPAIAKALEGGTHG